MTAAALTQIPLAAGGALLSAAGRVARWGLAQYAKAPLSNTAIAAVAALSVMAGSNALFLQSHEHPSPMFGGTPAIVVASPSPVVPAVRKKKTVVPSIEQTSTGSVPVKASSPSTEPIGNTEVFELQRKLEAIGYFDGKVDGYYGPKTARAIKRFEEANGMKVKGELTRQIIAAIAKAPITAQQPKPAPLVAPEPVPAADRVVTQSTPPAAAPNLATETIVVAPEPEPEPVMMDEAQPVAEPVAMVEPLPTPAPLSAPVALSAPKSVEASIALPASRPLPATAEEVVEVAVEVANHAVDTAASILDGTAKMQLGPSQPMPAKPQQVAAVQPDPVAAVIEEEPVPVAVSSTDPRLVAKVQQGLANLGFLYGEIDGVAGEATAKAIRNFEVYFSYNVTGRISPELVDMLTDAGAYI